MLELKQLSDWLDGWTCDDFCDGNCSRLNYDANAALLYDQNGSGNECSFCSLLVESDRRQ